MPCRFSNKSNITLKKKSKFLKGEDAPAAHGMESYLDFIFPIWKKLFAERRVNYLDMSNAAPEFRHAVFKRIRRGELDNR